MSELESPKLKIAGNLQFSKATTGLITVVVKDKSTQMQQREVASLVVLGDSMERERERERERRRRRRVLKWGRRELNEVEKYCENVDFWIT